MLLDIVEVAKSHSGENLETAFAKIMDDYEISKKVLINSNIYIYTYINITHQILGVTCDNMSNNDMMIENLVMIILKISGKVNQSQCLVHIVNLVAKIILCQFDKSKERKKKKNDIPDNG